MNKFQNVFFSNMFNFWNLVMVNMSKKKELTKERKQNDIQMMRMAMLKTHVSLRTVRPQPYPPKYAKRKSQQRNENKWKVSVFFFVNLVLSFLLRIIPIARPKFYLVTLKSFRSINMLCTKFNQNDIFKWCISLERIGIACVCECIHRTSVLYRW